MELIKRELVVGLFVFARFLLCGALGWASPINPHKKKRPNQPNTSAAANTIHSFLWLFQPQPRNEELFCLLLWLAAGRWAPWGGVRFLHSIARHSSLHSISFFIEQRERVCFHSIADSSLTISFFSFIGFRWFARLFIGLLPCGCAAHNPPINQLN